ncbi:galactose-binding lectin l-1-like [Conger conger]|uniref:galactose-binding lectin l-1-like n=1 Tax=Conger conger TaxID=82655 RepID=UPI002A5AB374|nr:galactose-binding lectin l-1-like [Conger conger]
MTHAEVKNIPLNAAKQLTINGVPNDSFTINVGKSKDVIGLKYEVHFGKGTDQPLIIMSCIRDDVVINKYTETSFPFEKTEPFEMTISFNSDNFQIKISSKYTHFGNSLNEKYYDYIWFDGQVSIEGISII